MKYALSARNQLEGIVTKVENGAVNGIVVIDVNGTPVTATISMGSKIVSVEEGAVNGIVRIEVLGGNIMTSTISMGAIRELGLEPGVEAKAVVKATSVMVGI